MYYSSYYYITIYNHFQKGTTIEFKSYKKAKAFYEAMILLKQNKIIEKVEMKTGDEADN